MDVSPITARPEGRTGLARVALSLSRAVAARHDVDLRTCAWGSLVASDDFETVRREFPELRGVAARRGAWTKLCTAKTRAARSGGRWSRAFWHRAGQVTNRLRNPLAGVDLHGFDVVHSTYARFPRVVRRRGLPAVITLHDVMPLRLPPGDLPSGQVAITRRILAGIRPSDWVACVSEWTRDDFLAVHPHPRDRIVVIPNAVDHDIFRPVANAPLLDELRGRYGLTDRPFLLTLSSLATHKNLRFLIDAWRRCGAAHEGAVLVVAGGRTSDPTELAGMLGLDAAVPGLTVTGHVTDADVRGLASACQAFVFPSRYEGFGLPVLEAMACGAPVVASNATAIPEVVGSAGTLLPPDDQDAWTAALAEAARRPLRAAPCRASVERAARFSWAHAAERYATFYRAACA
jgi:glycosyltransferase involved in cell wall biosynthesis